MEQNKYLLHGKMTAKEGHRDQLAMILIEASRMVSAMKGSVLYAVSLDRDHPHSVFVTEIWDSLEDHDNSLKSDGVRELIMKAMPLLDGPPSRGQELEVIGGTGG